ncbi:type VI secretion system contractile sheath small subunit [Thiotrichales bacterium 19S3-7]|nr:type VI secretion system contractile sheath small subunit [Thiotrichales bacterium 19S3-7]MCF6802146.1 type VI secretion system contractile sheath small subunit [Thiotrichales bacterium 19S3-11]
MGKESSVAPKERVNIVYSPATDGVEEDVELAMKSLVIGEFTPEADSTPLVDRKAINVDKDNFNDVLKGQNLNLSINVRNCLDEDAKEDDEIAVKLKFESISDFTPDGIVEQVPELRQLIELRDALKAVRSPLGNVPEFRKRLASIIEHPDTRAQLLDELNLEDSKE